MAHRSADIIAVLPDGHVVTEADLDVHFSEAARMVLGWVAVIGLILAVCLFAGLVGGQ